MTSLLRGAWAIAGILTLARADRALGQPIATVEPTEVRAVGESTYRPITPSERVTWIADGMLGRSSVAAAAAVDVWQSAWNTPPEWSRTWSGAGLRLAEREADVALSNGIEAGLGAIWAEDPRYIPSPRRGVAHRTAYAVRTVFVAPRRDGRMAPAWGRYAANTVTNAIENVWLPPSQRTWQSTVLRSGNSVFCRLASNLWAEFSPDVVRAWSRRHRVAG